MELLNIPPDVDTSVVSRKFVIKNIYPIAIRKIFDHQTEQLVEYYSIVFAATDTVNDKLIYLKHIVRTSDPNEKHMMDQNMLNIEYLHSKSDDPKFKDLYDRITTLEKMFKPESMFIVSMNNFEFVDTGFRLIGSDHEKKAVEIYMGKHNGSKLVLCMNDLSKAVLYK